MRTIMLSTVAAVFAVGVASAEMRVIVDTDADGRISVTEFQAARADFEVFGAWDANGDGMLSRDEYLAGIEMQDDADAFGPWDEYYAGWDLDADNMLTREEYETGLWSTFDADDDDMWNEDETAAWEEDEMRYDATRIGAEVSAPSGTAGEAGATGGAAGGAGGTGGAPTQ